MRRTSTKLYLTLSLFIISWWTCAFYPSSQIALSTNASQAKRETNPVQASPYLQPLSRQKLHSALLGDTELITALMAEWETEARLLAHSGISQVKRLPADKYLKAQYLGRRLQAQRLGNLSEDRPELNFDTVVDDEGSALSLTTERSRFLPQTYVAASFLLALTPPEQVIALPKGFRDLDQLVPQTYVDAIPTDTGPYQTEVIAQQKPQLAFVAHYTLPATRQALLNLGAELFVVNGVNTIEEIQDSLQRVGCAVGRPEEAQLLSLFMEAALCALDNRLAAVSSSKRPDTLYLNYYSKFSTPTRRALTGHFLDRLKINAFPCFANVPKDNWQIPLEVEKIVQINPKAIILSSSHQASIKSMVLQHPALQQVSAIRNGKVFTVDEVVQESPSQFAVLAYFDLVNVLIEACNSP